MKKTHFIPSISIYKRSEIRHLDFQDRACALFDRGVGHTAVKCLRMRTSIKVAGASANWVYAGNFKKDYVFRQRKPAENCRRNKTPNVKNIASKLRSLILQVKDHFIFYELFLKFTFLFIYLSKKLLKFKLKVWRAGNDGVAVVVIYIRLCLHYLLGKARNSNQILR